MTEKVQGEPASPRTKERICASFERQGLMRLLGAQIAEIADGRVTVVLPSRPEVSASARTGDQRKLVVMGQQTLFCVR